MKTNLLTAIKLIDAIMKLSETPLDFASAHALVMAKAELEPHVRFFMEQEEKLLEKYAEKGEDGTPKTEGEGQYVIAKDKVAEFQRERVQLNGVEVEITKRKLKSIPTEITPAALEVMLLAFEFPDESEVKDDG
jgi:hypothetical protein